MQAAMRRARGPAPWPLLSIRITTPFLPILPFLLSVVLAPAWAKKPDLESIPEIRQLQGILRTASDRDSVRFLLAQVYRETGTMEGRDRALALLRQVRPRYYDTFRYHRELAQIYLDGQRYDDAREAMRRAVKRAPNEISARGELARMLFRHALRTCEQDDINELIRLLDETLVIAPEQRDALLYKSMALDLGAILDPARRAENALAARTCTEAILKNDPADLVALLLQGAHCLDLGEPDRADIWFQRGLALSPPEEQAAYLMPTLCAPGPVLQRLAAAPLALMDSIATSYWDSRDPTPLTAVNENLLEYWKRMVLADLFFAEPAENQRGWQTPRGELFVRYGPPELIDFEKASFEEGEAPVAIDLPLARRRARIVGPMSLGFLCPAQNWRYTFGGRPAEFSFVDPTLHDRFIEASPGTTEAFTRSTPSVLVDGSQGDFQECFVASAGTRGDGGMTRESIIIGLPAGEGKSDPWAGARVDLRVLDPVGRELSSEVLDIPERAARRLPAGAALNVIDRDVPLRPGRYTTEVRIATQARSGTFTRPLVVRSFGRDSLQISDLRLAFPPEPGDSGAVAGTGSAANPAGLVPRGAPLEVAFEVYNLVPTTAGLARYRVRYTVLPLAYAREYSRLLAAANAARDPALQFGGLGRSLGGVVLEEANYADLLFPPMEASLAPGARCRASFRLETSTLRDGSYALLVTLTDVNADRSVSARSPFIILPEEEFRTALKAE
jgi:GWxTD domain-containing protein